MRTPLCSCARLVAQGMLTNYQMQWLLAGEPFGLVLGNYRVLDWLGSGGMGVVYKAEHIHMKRPVALKVLAAEGDGNAVFLERFTSEMQALAALRHPNIVAGLRRRRGGRPREPGKVLRYLVMEYVAGARPGAARPGPRAAAHRRWPATTSARRPTACATPTSTAWSTATSSRPTCSSRTDRPARAGRRRSVAARADQDPRLRPGPPVPPPLHRGPRHARHRRLHGPGAGARRPLGGHPRRHLRPGRHALLAADRPAARSPATGRRGGAAGPPARDAGVGCAAAARRCRWSWRPSSAR